MKWFLNFTTRVKLVIAFGLVASLLALVIFIANTNLRTIQQTQNQLYQKEFLNALDLQRLKNSQSESLVDTQTMMLAKTPAEKQRAYDAVKARLAKSMQIQEALATRNQADPALAGKLADLRGLSRQRDEMRDTHLYPLLLAGNRDAAQSYFNQYNDYYNRLHTLEDELTHAADQRAEVAVQQSRAQTQAIIRLLFWVGVVAVAIALGLAIAISWLIATPLRQIADIAGQVAQGNLGVQVTTTDRKDEIGVLEQALHQMVSRLRDMNLEIQKGVNVLVASASEILAGATQVTAGANETAVAINQTMATVEEVKQTVDVTVEKVHRVSDSARKSVEIAGEGRRSVDKTFDGMARIQEQMEIISGSTQRLGEQSHTIGEIVAMVGDLADQSSMLAVNAAIEAAKAGEQGKGFAVVAQEVKSLAEQSRQATTQVRALLAEIQKAATGVILATEHGNRAVEMGNSLSREAGEALHSLARHVAESADAATLIAASAQQQLVGMDQVGLAMDSIRQASLQNVASTQQTETAAKDLHGLAQMLRDLSQQFMV